MNRIVRENYPVEALPEELRDMLPGQRYVRLVMEPVGTNEASMRTGGTDRPPDVEVLSLEQLFALRRPPYKTTEEIVAEIRRQRDEQDD